MCFSFVPVAVCIFPCCYLPPEYILTRTIGEATARQEIFRRKSPAKPAPAITTACNIYYAQNFFNVEHHYTFAICYISPQLSNCVPTTPCCAKKSRLE